MAAALRLCLAAETRPLNSLMVELLRPFLLGIFFDEQQYFSVGFCDFDVGL